MAGAYSDAMLRRQTPFPDLWLISDARNDAGLEQALMRLPRGSGFIFRHYHLPPALRGARWRSLARLCAARRIVLVLAGTPKQARQWRADGSYGPPAHAARILGQLRLVTAHNLREIAAANRIGADAVLLSPVFSTRSHPGAPTLGPLRFRLLAGRAQMPVIALGGMTHAKAKRLNWPEWAAIDGLTRRDS